MKGKHLIGPFGSLKKYLEKSKARWVNEVLGVFMGIYNDYEKTHW